MRSLRVLDAGLALGRDDSVVRVGRHVRLLLVARAREYRGRIGDQQHVGKSSLDLLDELLRRDFFAGKDERGGAVGLPVLHETFELRKGRRCVRSGDRERGVGTPLDSEVTQRGHDDGPDPWAIRSMNPGGPRSMSDWVRGLPMMTV